MNIVALKMQPASGALPSLPLATISSPPSPRRRKAFSMTMSPSPATAVALFASSFGLVDPASSFAPRSGRSGLPEQAASIRQERQKHDSIQNSTLRTRGADLADGGRHTPCSCPRLLMVRTHLAPARRLPYHAKRVFLKFLYQEVDELRRIYLPRTPLNKIKVASSNVTLGRGEEANP